MILSIYFGSVYSLDGMKNTAIVYLHLWSLEKFTEGYFELTDNGWPLALFVFCFIYYVAYKLNANPEFIVMMFK